MTPEERAEQWANVNRVMELVKQEGDYDCGRAFDFLLAERTAAVAEERERCARIANEHGEPERGLCDDPYIGNECCSPKIAAVIRAEP